MNGFNEGEIAWDILDRKTRKLLKSEIMSIYESNDGEISIDEIYEKLDKNIPNDVIMIAVGELIEEGKVIEEDINPGDILAIVRQNKITLKMLEKKVDIIAGGMAKIMRLLNDIRRSQDIVQEENIDDSRKKELTETEDSNFGED